MLEELKQLKELRRIAYNLGDFATMSNLNKRIFEIREKLRTIKEKQKQIEKDNKLANKIDTICKL